MKILYFMNGSTGDFSTGSSQFPACVSYPLRELKGVTVKNATEFFMIFQSPQAAGTDAENNTSGCDLITLHIKTSYNHKRAFRDIVQVIDKHLSKNNGFIVIADASKDPSQYPGSDFVDDPDLSGSINKFNILIDEPE